jgi:ATP-dependent Clp protease adaptor protein ClpS
MAWVAIMMAFGFLLGAVTMLAIVVALWLAYRRERGDWLGELQAEYDASTAAAGVENDASAPRPGPETDYSAASLGPQYHLVLLNDDTHTFHYVVLMLRDVFNISPRRGFALASEIDKQGRAVVFTGSLDQVNYKRTQVVEYGPDRWARRSEGPLDVAIEKAS